MIARFNFGMKYSQPCISEDLAGEYVRWADVQALAGPTAANAGGLSDDKAGILSHYEARKDGHAEGYRDGLALLLADTSPLYAWIGECGIGAAEYKRRCAAIDAIKVLAAAPLPQAAPVAQDRITALEAKCDLLSASLRKSDAVRDQMLVALQGVLRVADRQTVEFDAARAAIAKATGDVQ